MLNTIDVMFRDRCGLWPQETRPAWAVCRRPFCADVRDLLCKKRGWILGAEHDEFALCRGVVHAGGGRANLKTFLRPTQGRYIFTPPVLQ